MVLLLSFAAAFLFWWTGLNVALWRRRRLEERVRALLPSVQALQESGVDADEVKGSEHHRLFRVDRPALRLTEDLRQRMENYLGRAGITLTRRQWQVSLLTFILVPAASALLTRNLGAGLIVFVALWAAALAVIGSRRSKRQREFEEGLGDVLTTAAGALRAGYSFLQAVDILASESKGRMAEEFKRMLREMGLGVGMEEALMHAAERIALPDFDLIVSAILIQRQVGGNLAEVLDVAGETIRERMRIKGEIRSLTAQGRMSFWIFTLLTPGLAVVLYLFNPGYIGALWANAAGLGMLFVAAVGQVIGAVIIRRIVRIEV